ncbi:DUF3231 family protein [Anoxybacteroides tepidamans]|uniref:DUF3231 family protein n=1 Tax=Anoxybacteroides tepidamans TaxID=265948 RepID=UPI0006870002|nr:DUF3231 family protein [Anoxybacillus tepidamans]
MIDMQASHDVKLTAPEISALWSQYQNDTMARCVYKYMINIVEDASIRPILEFALSLAESHIPKIKEYFTQEQFPIPHGFTDEDVNSEAPRLFSDEACLMYTYAMSNSGLGLYADALAISMRKDVRDYFLQCQNEAVELFNRSLDLLLEKGFVSKPPFVYPEKDVEFVEKEGFFQELFRGKRPLSSIETTHVFFDVRKVQFSKSLTMAFAQTANSREVREFLWRGVEIYGKHIEVFESILSENQLPQPKSEEAEITNSTVAPFSDRLMLSHKAFLDSIIVAMYGTAIATCNRPDLIVNYSRLAEELVQYMKDTRDLMVKHRWLERPPMTENREALATNK